jgi:hypothetical protein
MPGPAPIVLSPKVLANPQAYLTVLREYLKTPSILTVAQNLRPIGSSTVVNYLHELGLTLPSRGRVIKGGSNLSRFYDANSREYIDQLIKRLEQAAAQQQQRSQTPIGTGLPVSPRGWHPRTLPKGVRLLRVQLLTLRLYRQYQRSRPSVHPPYR